MAQGHSSSKPRIPHESLDHHGKHDVRVETVPDPVLVENDDILLRVTATAICGSDLHLRWGSENEIQPEVSYNHRIYRVHAGGM